MFPVKSLNNHNGFQKKQSKFVNDPSNLLQNQNYVDQQDSVALAQQQQMQLSANTTDYQVAQYQNQLNQVQQLSSSQQQLQPVTLSSELSQIAPGLQSGQISYQQYQQSVNNIPVATQDQNWYQIQQTNQNMQYQQAQNQQQVYQQVLPSNYIQQQQSQAPVGGFIQQTYSEQQQWQAQPSIPFQVPQTTVPTPPIQQQQQQGIINMLHYEIQKLITPPTNNQSQQMQTQYTSSKSNNMSRSGKDKKMKKSSRKYYSSSRSRSRSRRSRSRSWSSDRSNSRQRRRKHSESPKKFDSYPKPPVINQGDWKCLRCSNWNYERRERCNMCKLDRNDNVQGIKFNKYKPQIDKRKSKQQPNHNGDWECLNCKNINYYWREVCNRCKEKKKDVIKNQQSNQQF